MAVTGIARYLRLFKNITNWQEYLLHKGKRKIRSLYFTTRPLPITFEVPESLYQVFKEVFMEDFYQADQLMAKLPLNPVIIDVGANAGFFNVLLFSKIESAQVYAYEPMPSNIALFKKTIAANSAMRSIQLHQMAVTGSAIDVIELYTNDTDNNTVVSSIFSEFNPANTRRITVPAQSLSAIIESNKLEKVDLLKLDCEGSEYDIIYNTAPEVLKKIHKLVIEVHELDKEKNNLQALDAHLNGLGYKTNFAPVQEGSFYMEASRN